MKVELVISIFDYNPDWIKFINNTVKISLYRKGNQKSRHDEILLEPNVGRDVHTFFNHILNNYDQLSDITFFCQDFPFDHWENIIQTVNGNLSTFSQNSQMKIGGYFGYHYNTFESKGNYGFIPEYEIKKIRGSGMWHMHHSYHHSGLCIKCDSTGMPQHGENLHLNKWWGEFFEGVPPNLYEFIPGGHFGVTSDHARMRSKNFYSKIVKFLETYNLAPWVIERFEPYIFNSQYKELHDNN